MSLIHVARDYITYQWSHHSLSLAPWRMRGSILPQSIVTPARQLAWVNAKPIRFTLCVFGTAPFNSISRGANSNRPQARCSCFSLVCHNWPGAPHAAIAEIHEIVDSCTNDLVPRKLFLRSLSGSRRILLLPSNSKRSLPSLHLLRQCKTMKSATIPGFE
jgi:hypothetical protein